MAVEQIKAIEDELRHAIVAADTVTPVPRMLIELKGIGNEFATVLWTECLYRRFDNRRQVAAYAGLALAEWVNRSRTGSLEGRQSALAGHAASIGLAVATPPTRLGSEPMVPGSS